MKCIRCGYESPVSFQECPRCGTLQPAPQNQPSYAAAKKTGNKSGAEIAAIVISILVSVFSIIAAFVILIAFTAYQAVKTSDQYGIDAVDDFDSNEYDDDLDQFFKDYYSGENKYTSETPAGLNTPISFKKELYSFSEGEVQTEYEVTMTGVYRGEAALKMLEGATLPEYDPDAEDIYLARFTVKITNQDKEAIVTLPMSYPAAYPSNTVRLFSSDYNALSSLDYVNKYSLISKGEELETYIAFIVSKDDQSPCIRWDLTEDKVFRSEEEAVSDASTVEAGIAIDVPEESSTLDDTSSEQPEESSSDDAASN